MKKVLGTIVGIMSIVVIFTGCANTSNQNNQGGNNNASNVSQSDTSKNNNQNKDDKFWKFDESKVVKTDILTGEKLNYKHELTGISSDGKTFKLNDEIGEKEIEGFEGTPKSVKYIHEERLEKSGTLAILNTDGEVYISNGGIFAPKIYMSKVHLEEKVKAIATTSSYKNARGVVLMVTEDDVMKAIDDESFEAYKFIEEEEKGFSSAYEKIVGDGEMWMPVFTINPETNEKVYFEEPVSMYMFMDRDRVSFEDNKNNIRKYGIYKIDQETCNVEIMYDENDEKETLIYVDNLGDNEGYLKITQKDGLERYYRN